MGTGRSPLRGTGGTKAPGISLISVLDSRPLLNRHGPGSRIGQQVDRHVLGGQFEQVVPRRLQGGGRWARVVNRIGSTEWIRNGSMIVRDGSSAVVRTSALLPWAMRASLWRRASKLPDGEWCFILLPGRSVTWLAQVLSAWPTSHRCGHPHRRKDILQPERIECAEIACCAARTECNYPPRRCQVHNRRLDGDHERAQTARAGGHGPGCATGRGGASRTCPHQKAVRSTSCRPGAGRPSAGRPATRGRRCLTR